MLGSQRNGICPFTRTSQPRQPDAGPSEPGWAPSPPAQSYLGGSVGVHQDHVLRALLDLELDVILSFQGSQAAAAGAHSRLAVWGVWGQRAFWVKTKKVTILGHFGGKKQMEKTQ